MRYSTRLIGAGLVIIPGLAVLPSGCSGKVAATEGACKAVTDCSLGEQCIQGVCRKQVKVGALLVDYATREGGRGLAHSEALKDAAAQLGNVDLRIAEGVWGEAVVVEVEKMVAEGRELIIFDSFDHRVDADFFSKKYPNVKFLLYSGRPVAPNLGAYSGHLEQAWYVAGITAASEGAKKNKRLGFIGSYITPEVVRNINAYARGAQRITPDIKVEVRWLGFWYDYNTVKTFQYTPSFAGPNAESTAYYAEEYAAALLIDGGAEVIAHHSAVPRATSLVERLAGKIFEADGTTPRRVLSVASDNEFGWRSVETNAPLKTAMGAVYWNWAPLYAGVFEDMMTGEWQPYDLNEPLNPDRARSLFGFVANPELIDDQSANIWLLESANRGYAALFRGPYQTTGQRDFVSDGETLSDAELRHMCWFVKGVVEKANPLDPSSPDIDARVPTTANPASAAPKPTAPPYVLLPVSPGVPRGVGWNCDENQIPE